MKAWGQPLNDRFADATQLVLAEGTNRFQAITTYATAESGEPPVWVGAPAVRTLWWWWKPSWPGEAAVTIREFDVDAVHWVGVYHGDAFSALTRESSMRAIPGGGAFDLVAGRAYRFQVEGGYGWIDRGCEVTVLYDLLTPMLPVDGFAAGDAAPVGAAYGRLERTPSTVTFLVARDLGSGTFDQPQIVGLSTNAPFGVNWIPPAPGNYELRLSASFPDGQAIGGIPRNLTVAVGNDHFATPTVLAGDTLQVRYSNATGGAQTGEPWHAGQPPIETQWWQWTASADGIAELTFSLFSGKRTLAVYTGDRLGRLTLVADNRPASGDTPAAIVRFAAAQGETYRIVMGRWPGETPFMTDWSLLLRTFFLTHPATESVAPVGQPLLIEARISVPSLTNVWGGNVVLSAAKWGEGPSFVQEITAPPYRAYWVPTVPGLYHLMGKVGTNRTIEVLLTVTPENDAFANPARLQLEGCTWVGQGNSAGSTLEPGETGSLPSEGSVWFDWVPPQDGLAGLYLGASGSGVVTAYQGSVLTNLTVLADAGAGYWFRVPVLRGVPVRLGVRSYRVPGALTEDNGGPLELRALPLAQNEVFERSERLVLRDTGDGTARGQFGFANVHSLDGSLWWHWTAPTNGDLWIESSEPNQPGSYGQVSLLTGDNPTNLVQASSRSGSRGAPVRVIAKAGMTYRLAMVGSYAPTPACRPVTASAVFVAGPSRPANDDFAHRQVLAGPRIDLTVTLQNASAEPAEPYTTDATLWYSYTAPSTGVLAVTATAEGYQPYVSLFRGTALESLEGSTASSFAETRLLAGETVHIRLAEPQHSFDRPLPPITLRLEFDDPPPPPNDRFADRIELPGPTWDESGRIDNAGFEPGENAWTVGGTLWWSYTPTMPGIFCSRVVAADFTPCLAAWAEGTFPNLGLVQTSSGLGAALWVPMNPGSTLHFSLASQDSLRGAFRMTGEFLSASDNNDFALRVPLSGRHTVAQGFATGATAEFDEPSHSPDGRGMSLWWTWTAPSTGPVELANTSFYPGVLAVYEGDALWVLQRVPATEPTPGVVRFEAVRHTTYQIAMDAISDWTGYARFSLDMRDPPTVRGRFEWVRRMPDGSIQWRHVGQPGFRYRLDWRINGGDWQPLSWLDDPAGTQAFVTALHPDFHELFYRSVGVD
jgi:hypothetical protein